MNVTFITGNVNKAKYLSELIGIDIKYQSLDLREIQSLDIREIVTYKALEAFHVIGEPVLVEDVSLEFESMGGLPGPFIKFFLQAMSLKEICHLLDGTERKAVVRCIFGYCIDGDVSLVEAGLKGTIAFEPEGHTTFGFDSIFIPDGYQTTRAMLSKEDDLMTYMQMKPIKAVKELILNSKHI